MPVNETLIIKEGHRYIYLRYPADRPVMVDSPWSATHWKELSEAKNFCNHYPDRNWVIKRFEAVEKEGSL